MIVRRNCVSKVSFNKLCAVVGSTANISKVYGKYPIVTLHADYCGNQYRYLATLPKLY